MHQQQVEGEKQNTAGINGSRHADGTNTIARLFDLIPAFIKCSY